MSLPVWQMRADHLAIELKPTDRILTRTRFKANPMAVRSALQYARQSWQSAGIASEVCNTGEQVLAEVLNNVVEHAQAGRPNGQIELDTRLSDGDVICAVRDDGAEMPRQQLPAGNQPVLSDDPLALPEGGFGWLLIHTLTTELIYDRCNGWNRLEFRIAHTDDTSPSI